MVPDMTTLKEPTMHASQDNPQLIEFDLLEI